MAARKKRALTPEEQLEAALVPEGEWPYEVPDNWCWTRLGEATEIIMGQSPVGASVSNDQTQIPLIGGASDMTADSLVASRYTSQPTKLSKEGDIVICVRATLGNPVIANDTYCLGRGVGAIRTEKLNRNFICRFIDSSTDYLFAHATGSTFQQVSGKVLGNMPLPLPPFPEQQRIASRIERLFAKLDDAEAELREVIDSSEQRRAAILHSAFSGKLSESWRTTHNVNQDTWTVKRFDEIAYIRSNLVDPAAFADYPHIAPDNIEKKTGTLLPYRTIGEDGVTSGKHHFYPGQILYSKIRPYLSKAVVVDFEGLCSADMYPIEAIEDTRYLWYYILSEDFLEQTYSAGSRTVLPKINQKELSAIKVPIPTEAEQRFISEALDAYFEHSREAESRAMDALHQIQNLKQSILAKALRGKLGTNNPDEPSSKELLVENLK